MQITKEQLRRIIKEELEAVLGEKKKKKSKGKKDACYHKVRSRYDVWPSAYASGALVKCRKVGAKNWGNSKKEGLEEEFIPGGESSKYGQVSVDEMIEGIAEEHGVSTDQIRSQFEMGVEEEMEHAEEELIAQEIALDHLVEDPEYYTKLGQANLEEANKAGTESSKENNLRDWFKRKGAKGKKGGWVDCNAPDGKGGYKSCGRSDGEKRSKYPSCRPTPGACKEKGKGKSWGKKSAKGKKK